MEKRRLNIEAGIRSSLKDYFNKLGGDDSKLLSILSAFESASVRNKRDGQAFRLRFGFGGDAPLLFREVGERLDLSGNQARMRVERATRILKMMSRGKKGESTPSAPDGVV